MKNLFAYLPKTVMKAAQTAVFVAVAVAGIAAAQPAMADPHGHPGPAPHNRDWDRHERGARDWHHHYPVGRPGVVYAPPAIVEAPPPPPSGINLIIPFDIR